MTKNVLYLAVLPVVHLDNGRTEQILTLFPDKGFATEFQPNDVDTYIGFFQLRAKTILSGAPVTGYEFSKLPGVNGRVIVQVIQNVT